VRNCVDIDARKLSMSTAGYRAYAPRPIRPLGVVELHGFQLKRYWIDLECAPAPDSSEWSGAIALAAAFLPTTPDPARPQLGFLILHRGRGADYLVLGWWAHENELPMRVVVRYPGTVDVAWRAARGEESVCVWDLDVIAFEREAYVSTLLSGADPAAMRQAYLERVLDRP
jgi:hypothetical protein